MSNKNVASQKEKKELFLVEYIKSAKLFRNTCTQESTKHTICGLHFFTKISKTNVTV